MTPGDFDHVYDQPDAGDLVAITMTRRQWWHIHDWRGEHPDRYPCRARERQAALVALDQPQVPTTATWPGHE